MNDENNIDFIALGIAGLKVASAGAQVFNAVGGTKGLASVGLKHCSHCKGCHGPCQCAFGCPIPNNALRKTQCFPTHKGVSCDSCGRQDFPGSRFKCQTCSDFDLCQSCYEGGRHDNTHPFFHIAALGRLPERLKPRRDAPAAPPIPAPSYNHQHQHHSSVSSSTSTAASLSSTPNASAAAAATSSSIPKLHHQHTGIRCIYCCDDQNLQGNRFNCQTCDNFDLCQSCFENHSHNRSHVFVLIASEGATPISLAKPHNADSQTTTASPLRANAPREPQFHPSDVRHRTFTAVNSKLPFAPHFNGRLSESDGPDSTPPYFMESSTSFSSSSFSSSQPNQRRYQHTTDASSILDTSSTSLRASELHRNVYCVGPRCQGARHCILGPRYTCANCPPSVDLCEACYTSRSAHNISHSFKRFDKADQTTFMWCPPQTQQPHQQQQSHQERHINAFCKGARCRGATQCIVGPRYTCADCPPSIDLCHSCYTSNAAHNISHAFIRFDKAGLTTYVLCPPQMRQPQQQQQSHQERHVNVFCKGARCRGATQCIVGPRYTCADCPPSIDLCHSCYTSNAAHNISHAFIRFDKAGQTTYVLCPPQMPQPQQQQQSHQEHHVNFFCDGPRCCQSTQCIVGPRYSCADCPPSIDLCQTCYSSQSAHSTSHSFMRFDKPGVATYALCPPQMQQPGQTRQEQHVDVFCDGPWCHGATQCIVGPRYTCANCPPSLNLCQTCYSSQSAHTTSHSFMRFDKPGVTRYVLCPPQMQQRVQQVNTRPGSSHVGTTPPYRPSTNVANQGGEDPPDRFQQVLHTGLQILENEQREREREEREARILAILQQNQQDTLEYQNSLLAQQQEMLNQQQTQYLQQDPVSIEQCYDDSYQYTPEVDSSQFTPEVDMFQFNFEGFDFSGGF